MKEILKESPYPCVAEYRALVSNAYLLEQETHKFLDAKREKENREWFRCSVKEAQDAIEKISEQQSIEIILSEDSKTKSIRKSKVKNRPHIVDIFSGFESDTDSEEIEKIWAVFLKRKDLAQQGNANAQYELAQMYQLGEGIKQDTEKAIKWYEKSANQENVEAQVNLGRVLCNTSIHNSYDKAIIWFRKAAEQKNTDAYYYLGNMYQHGRGVKIDFREVENFYIKAIESGDDEMKKKGHC
jgi:TPR repeat protein